MVQKSAKMKVKYNVVERVKPKLKLRKRRAKAYLKFWDEMGETSASEEFERKFRAQNGRRPTCDDDEIEISDNERVQEVEGRGSREADMYERSRSRDRGGDRQRRRSPPMWH